MLTTMDGIALLRVYPLGESVHDMDVTAFVFQVIFFFFFGEVFGSTVDQSAPFVVSLSFISLFLSVFLAS